MERKPLSIPSDSSLPDCRWGNSNFAKRTPSKSDDSIIKSRAKSLSPEQKQKIQVCDNESNSKRHLELLSQKVIEIGKGKAEDLPICSVYMTTTSKTNEKYGGGASVHLPVNKLIEAIDDILIGKVRIQETVCGFVVEFTKEADLERILKLRMAKIFGFPVFVWKFPIGNNKYKKTVILKDIPWCIPIVEIQNALINQGIRPVRVSRKFGCIRIEVTNSCDTERLLKEGLNFFNCNHFPVTLEAMHGGNEMDIVQCYRCQRFWHTASHCKQPIRCVRCGEPHDVSNCSRLRNDAVCCLCGGPHHAAHKMCPARLQHITSMEVEFSLSKKPMTTRLPRF